jgi:hypothetical protein
MKGLKRGTWPLRGRPTLLACAIAMRQERQAYEENTMTAYEEAARQVEVSGGVAVVAPAPQEPVRRPLIPVSIDSVDDDELEMTPDIYELGCIAPIVAGEDDVELEGTEPEEGEVQEQELDEEEEAA